LSRSRRDILDASGWAPSYVNRNQTERAMSEPANPLTEQQHRLFAEELKAIESQLDAFREGLDHRYGQACDAARSLAQAIDALKEVETHMAEQLHVDHPDIQDEIYGN